MPVRRNSKIALPLGLALAALLTGCSVYHPALVHTPLVQEAGQTEISVVGQFPTQGGVQAAWSPVRHVLLTGSAEHLWGLGADERHTATQGDLGLGTYATLGQGKWLLGALGGFGLTRSDFHYEVAGSPTKDYAARYQRMFGQLQVVRQSRHVAVGVAWRLTGLRFTRLTFNGQAVLEPVARLYQAPVAFLRVGSGAWQGQLQAGVSQPGGGQFRGRDTDLYGSQTLLSAGVVLRPHLLGRSQP